LILLKERSTHGSKGPGHDQADARSYTYGTQPCRCRGGFLSSRFLCHGDTLRAPRLLSTRVAN
jgi:hypothetical protein